MSGGGYDIGAGFSSSSPSASSANSPLNNQGGGGGLTIFAPGANNTGSVTPPKNPKSQLYVVIAGALAVTGLILILLLLKK